jgi:hypothetical protein
LNTQAFNYITVIFFRRREKLKITEIDLDNDTYFYFEEIVVVKLSRDAVLRSSWGF